MPAAADGAAPVLPADVETAGVTATIAQLVSGFDGARLDEPALTRAKHGMLDALGVALAGVNEPVSKIMLDYAAELPADAVPA